MLLRFILLAVAPALSFVLFNGGWRCLGHGGRFSLPQQFPLLLYVFPLRIDSLLLSTTHSNNLVLKSEKVETKACFCLQTNLKRFWKANPSVHCSVNEAPWRTVEKWPRRRRSCMLLSLQAIFSCFDYTTKVNVRKFNRSQSAFKA